MKVFIQNNKSNPIVKIIKEEKMYQECWDVTVHTLRFENNKILCSSIIYDKVSDATKAALVNPKDYEFYGSYTETSFYDLKYPQARCIGVRIIMSIFFPEEMNRREILSAYLSRKNFTVHTVHLLAQIHDWSFEVTEERKIKNYVFTAEPTKKEGQKVEVQKPQGKYMKLIDKILYDEEERIVIVFFVDGTKIVKKCHSEDKFDIYIGVSLAITKYLFGNNTTNFIKFVDRKKKKVLSKKKRKTKNK